MRRAPGSIVARLGATLIATALACACAGPAVPPPPAGGEPRALQGEAYARDFDHMCTFVRERYCFFADKAIDWDAVCAHHRPLAAGARDQEAFIRVLEAALDELHDPHTHLGTNLASSFRLPPHDLWAEWRDGKAVVLDVRRGSAAARAGVRPGMVVVSVDGEPIAEAASRRGPHLLKRPDPEARTWALLSVLAGRHDRPRALVLTEGTTPPVTRVLDDSALPSGDPPPAVESRRRDDGIAHIQIRTFGSDDVVDAFDAALARHRDARGIVLDVRDNDGGDTAVAVPILGRFITERARYAWMARREGESLSARWPEHVEPRGPFTFEGPVVVLVNHFSMSMAEGFAMAIAGMGRGAVVGTRMAGLGAAIARTTLPGTGISVQISAEPVYDAAGRPRWLFEPQVPVDLRGTDPDTEDPILTAGLRALEAAARR